MRPHRFALRFAAFLLALASASCSRNPQKIVWAWERPEDLRSLRGVETPVAFWAGTLHVGVAARIDFLPRTQALRLPASAAPRPVVRIETSRGVPTEALTPALASSVAGEIIASTRRYHPTALQIDFDAARSERPFYRQVLHELRARLPHGTFLSMTALASWCLHDRWLEGLPVDEVVPMFFRMGPDSGSIRAELARRSTLPEPMCRSALGLSIDEPLEARPQARTVYYFNPRSWMKSDLEKI